MGMNSKDIYTKSSILRCEDDVFQNPQLLQLSKC